MSPPTAYVLETAISPDPGLLTHSVYVCPDTKETGTATKKLLGCDLWLGAEQSTDRAVDLSVGHLLSFCNNIINESEAKKKENKHTFDVQLDLLKM